MAEHYCKWLDIVGLVGNGSKRQAVNDWKWIVILEWLEMAVHCWKLLKIAGCGQKWLEWFEVAKNG